MNLMFWKKKTATKGGADISQQDSDSNVTSQETWGAEPTDQEPTEPVVPEKSGLFARIKSGLAALMPHSKKTPAPNADEDADSSADTRRATGQGSEDRGDTGADSEVTAKPGLFARIKSRFAALTGRAKKVPDAEAEDESRRAKSAVEETAEEVVAIKPRHSKKFWIIGGAILLLILLGVGIYAAIDYILPPLTRNNLAAKSAREREEALKAIPKQEEQPKVELPIVVPHPVTIEPPKIELPQSAVQPTQAVVQPAQSAVQPTPPAAQPVQSAIPSAQSAVPPVQPAAQPVKQPAKTLPTTNKGDMVVGNKEPKDTAMSLKKAIETMNKELGEPVKKSAK